MSLGLGSSGGFSSGAADAWANDRSVDVPASSLISKLNSYGTDPAQQCGTHILIISDSTGIEPSTTEGWPYLFAQRVATKNPDAAVMVRFWDVTNQRYGYWANLNSGNTQRYIDIDTGTRTLTNSEIGSFTDLDITVDMDPDTSWTPGTTRSIIAQYGSSGSYGHRFQLTSAGGFRFAYSTDGTTSVNRDSTAGHGLTTGRYQVRVTVDVDNGAAGHDVKFYKKPTNSDTWTQVGATVTGAGTISIYRPAARPFELGGNSTTATVPGKYYEALYRNGIDGPVINPQGIENWINNEDIAPVVGAPTIYISIGAQGGAGITPSDTATSGFLNATRLAKMVPPIVSPTTVILNTGHNEIVDGPAWATSLDSWLTAMKAALPFAHYAVITQNPRADTITTRHRKRMGDLVGWAAKNGIPAIDTYSAYLKSTAGLGTLLQGDDLHPTADGALVQVSPVINWARL